MMETLLHSGLSNACIATLLATIVWILGRRLRVPHLTHWLWLLVFIKLLTPPLVNLPMITLPTQANLSSAWSDSINSSDSEFAERPIDGRVGHSEWVSGWPSAADAEREWLAASMTPMNDKKATDTASIRQGIVSLFTVCQPWILAIWLSGSVILVARSLYRAFRFDRLLRGNVQPASSQLQDEAVRLSQQLGLTQLPRIVTTDANLAPMVWWTGGPIQVVMPNQLLRSMKQSEWRLVLAHELAHVRRRDYLVRWLEWLGCVCFWWNPIVWIAQRNLRESEEVCCDALVVSTFTPRADTYAESLLKAVESLAFPVHRPPAMASEINSGGFLERRFQMILSDHFHQTGSSWARMVVLAAATLVLPVSLVTAQDFDAIEKRLGLAVHEGEISLQQAQIMLEALRDSSREEFEEEENAWEEELSEEEEIEEEADGRMRRIIGALTEAGVEREAIGPALDIVRKIHIDMLENGERFELSEDIQRFLSRSLELDRNQIGTVLRLAEYLADEEGSETDRRRKHSAISEWIEAVGSEMRLSGEEARERLQAAESLAARAQEYSIVLEQLESAVEEGDVSRKEAEQKLMKLRVELLENQKEQKEMAMAAREREYEIVVKRIKEAIHEGELTEEDGEKKLYEIRMKLLGEEDNEPEVLERKYRAVIEDLRAAVEREEISQEQAKAELIELRLRIADEQEREREVELGRLIEIEVESELESDRDLESDVELESDREIRLDRSINVERDEEGILLRLKAAVERGELSEEEVAQQEREYALRARERMGQVKWVKEALEKGEISPRDGSLKVLEIQMNDAIDRGEISKEEAKQKIKEVIEESENDPFS